ncbi:hypothetical protein [Providencia sp. Me31A]|uniref:hypothetical protein n=1 Tax=Providencia sp. Me31A TaxID=3392637 RepID=UPI003D276667
MENDKFGYSSEHGISIVDYEKKLQSALKRLSEKSIGDSIAINLNGIHSKLTELMSYFPVENSGVLTGKGIFHNYEYNQFPICTGNEKRF